MVTGESVPEAAAPVPSTAAVAVTPEPPHPDTLIQVVYRNVADVVPSTVRTLGRAVAMAIESIIGAVIDLLTGRYQWREMLRQCW